MDPNIAKDIEDIQHHAALLRDEIDLIRDNVVKTLEANINEDISPNDIDIVKKLQSDLNEKLKDLENATKKMQGLLGIPNFDIEEENNTSKDILGDVFNRIDSKDRNHQTKKSNALIEPETKVNNNEREEHSMNNIKANERSKEFLISEILDFGEDKLKNSYKKSKNRIKEIETDKLNDSSKISSDWIKEKLTNISMISTNEIREIEKDKLKNSSVISKNKIQEIENDKLNDISSEISINRVKEIKNEKVNNTSKISISRVKEIEEDKLNTSFTTSNNRVNGFEREKANPSMVPNYRIALSKKAKKLEEKLMSTVNNLEIVKENNILIMEQLLKKITAIEELLVNKTIPLDEDFLQNCSKELATESLKIKNMISKLKLERKQQQNANNIISLGRKLPVNSSSKVEGDFKLFDLDAEDSINTKIKTIEGTKLVYETKCTELSNIKDEIKTASKEKENLVDELNTMNEKVKQLNKILKEKQIIECLKSQLRFIDNEICKTEKNLENTKEENDNLSFLLDEHESEIREIRQKYLDLLEQYEFQKNIICKIEEDNETRIETCNIMIEKFKNKLDQKICEYSKLPNIFVSTKTQLHLTVELNKTKHDECLKLEKKIDYFKTVAKQLAKEVDDITKHMSTHIKDKTDYFNKINELTTKLKIRRDQIKEFEQIVEELYLKLKEKQQQLEKEKHKINEIKKTIDALKCDCISIEVASLCENEKEKERQKLILENLEREIAKKKALLRLCKMNESQIQTNQ